MLAEDLTRRLSPEVLSRRPAVPVRSRYPPVGVYIASSLSLHPSRSCRRSSLTYHLRLLPCRRVPTAFNGLIIATEVAKNIPQGSGAG